MKLMIPGMERLIQHDTVLGRVVRWPLRMVPPGLVVPVLQGPLRGWRWVVGSTNHGCWLGTYEHQQQRAMARHIRPGSVVYDVGANVGFYTLLAAKLAGTSGRVVAFEPLPRNLAFLKQHLRINDVSNVVVVPGALANTNGVCAFDETGEPSMAKLQPDGGMKVEVATLDQMVAVLELPDPDVIKIDVEGAELDVLQGGENVLRRTHPTVFVSTHSDRLKADCLDWFRQAGFVCVEHSDDVLLAQGSPVSR